MGQSWQSNRKKSKYSKPRELTSIEWLMQNPMDTDALLDEIYSILAEEQRQAYKELAKLLPDTASPPVNAIIF